MVFNDIPPVRIWTTWRKCVRETQLGETEQNSVGNAMADFRGPRILIREEGRTGSSISFLWRRHGMLVAIDYLSLTLRTVGT